MSKKKPKFTKAQKREIKNRKARQSAQLPGEKRLKGKGKPGKETFTQALLGTWDFVSEPEFADGLFHPVDAMVAFEHFREQTEAEMGPMPREASEDEVFNRNMTVYHHCLPQLLTSDIVDELVRRCERLARRLFENGEQDEASAVALILAVCRDNEALKYLSTVGLVYALIQQSVRTGYELVLELLAPGDGAEPTASETKDHRRAEQLDRLKFLVKQQPGLVSQFQAIAASAWMMAFESVRRGEENLRLFEFKETLDAMDIVMKIAADEEADAPSDEQPAGEVREQASEPEVSGRTKILFNYLSGLLSESRIGEMLDRLREFRKRADASAPLKFFVSKLEKSLMEANAERRSMLLLPVLMGEIQVMFNMIDSHDEHAAAGPPKKKADR